MHVTEESSISDRTRELEGKDDRIAQLEKTLLEKTGSIVSLQGEVELSQGILMTRRLLHVLMILLPSSIGEEIQFILLQNRGAVDICLPEDVTNSGNRGHQIGPFESTKGECVKLKVKVRVNLHGIVSVESATMFEDEVDVPFAAVKEPPKESMEMEADEPRNVRTNGDVQSTTGGPASGTENGAQGPGENPVQMETDTKVKAYPVYGGKGKAKDPLFGLTMGSASQSSADIFRWFCVESQSPSNPSVILIHGFPSQGFQIVK